MLLCDLLPGETAIIKGVSNKTPLCRRLKDIGFTNGNTVTCIMNSPLGEPTAYCILDTIIALRHNDCNKIHIKKVI